MPNGTPWPPTWIRKLCNAKQVSGQFRVHRAGCQDTAREARRSDSTGAPEEHASKAEVVRALWAGIIAEDPDTYGTPGGMASLEAETVFLACIRGLPDE